MSKARLIYLVLVISALVAFLLASAHGGFHVHGVHGGFTGMSDGGGW